MNARRPIEMSHDTVAPTPSDSSNSPDGHTPSSTAANLENSLSASDATPTNTGAASPVEPASFAAAMVDASTAARDEGALRGAVAGVPGASFARGTLIGDYELIEPLGRGGMGVVYKARQRSANRIVALKLLARGGLGDDAVQHARVVGRFRTEVEAAARLYHEHVVPLYEADEWQGIPFYSMRYVEGGSLHSRLTTGPLESRLAAAAFRPLADALAVAHGSQVFHRDLKPANLLWDQGADRLLIADFGLAKLAGDARQLTFTGDLFGSPPYMSPEQISNPAAVGAAADIYGLGASLYHALTGRPPFQAATVEATLRQVVEQEVIAPRLLNPAIDRDLETICLKCLEKQPERRYSSARALGDDLQRYLEHRPLVARPISAAGRLLRWCRRNRSLAAVLVLSIIAPTVAFMIQYRATQEQRRLNFDLDIQRERSRKSEEKATRQLNQIKEAIARSLASDAQQARERGGWERVLELVDRARDSSEILSPELALLEIEAMQSLARSNDMQLLLNAYLKRDDLSPREQALGQMFDADLSMLSTQDPDAARKKLEHVLTLDLPAARHAYVAGLAANNAEESIRQLRRALSLDRHQYSARATLLMTLVMTGRDDDVQEEARTAELLYPDDYMPDLCRAFSAMFQQRDDEAASYLALAKQRLSEDEGQQLIDLFAFMHDAQKLMGGSLANQEQGGWAMTPSMVAQIGGMTLRSGKLLMSAGDSHRSSLLLGFPNLPWLHASWGRLPRVLLKAGLLGNKNVAADMHELADASGDGMMRYLDAVLYGESLGGKITPEAGAEVNRRLRVAANSPSIMPQYRRNAEFWAMVTSGFLIIPDDPRHDREASTQIIAIVSRWLDRPKLSLAELAALSDTAMRARHRPLATRIAGRFRTEHSADAGASPHLFQLAVFLRDDLSVVELGRRFEQQKTLTPGQQAEFDQARERLRKLLEPVN